MTQFFSTTLYQHATRICHQFIRARHGNVLLVTAIAIPVILAAAGLAIDLNRYMKSSGYIQSAVDQAAIASVAVDGQDRQEVATRFFNASLSDEIKQYITLNSISVSESFPPGGPLSVTVSAKVTLTNALGGFVGVSSSGIEKSGRATRAVENVEAVVTMASSGTMCAKKKRIPNSAKIVKGDTLVALDPDPKCTNFKAMKQGVTDFIDIIESNETVADFKVGLVPYNYKVKMPDLKNIPPSLKANEPKGFYENLADAEPLAAVVPLTSNMASLRTQIDNMKQTPEGIAWSRSDLGTHVAGLMLNPADKAYFNGESPKAFGDAATQKVVIIMTDGANTGCCYTNWPQDNYENQYVYFHKPYNDDQLKLCSVLKEQGVQIFTILFDVQETDAGGAEINNVFARCASGAYDERGLEENPNAKLKCDQKQNCYNVATDEDLKKAYRQIAQTFYKPSLSE